MKPNRGSIVPPEIPKRLQAALMRIRGDHPFFGTLALFAEFRVTDGIDTAATDGNSPTRTLLSRPAARL